MGTRRGGVCRLCVAVFVLLVFMAAEGYCNPTPTERRARVVEAIREGEAGLKVLAEALDDPDALVRGTAARGLARIGEPGADILSGALANDDPAVRRIALTALHSMDRLTDEQVAAAGMDEDEEVRQAAVELIDLLARWNFAPDTPEAQHVFTLRGSTRLEAGGPSGICIRSFPGHPIEQKVHGAAVENHPALTPEGAFSIEMWIKPDPRWINREGAFRDYTLAYLVDKKYITDKHPRPEVENHNDYKIYIRTPFRFSAWLGFGKESDSFGSERVDFQPGKWHHFLFTYDGAGEGRFYLDGDFVGGEVKEGRGSITRGPHRFVIGDRVADWRGFPGQIDSVRLHHRVIEAKP